MGSGASKKQLQETPRGRSEIRNFSTSQSSACYDETSSGRELGHSKVEEDEIQEEIERMAQRFNRTGDYFNDDSLAVSNTAQPDEVSLAFESFLHKDGTLYTCFTQNGIRLYFDEEKGLVPFPQELYSQGRFINIQNWLSGSSDSVENAAVPGPSYMDNERTSGCYLPGKGMVMTYIFEERTNVCKYFDNNSGAWLILPLQWEINLDFIKYRVQQVKEALPAITDYKEIAAALRQCNYNPDEVISIFLAIFGDSLESSAEGETFEETFIHSDLFEKDSKIESLNHKLQEREREMENLHVRCRCLQEENHRLTHMTQFLHARVAEIEAERESALERIKALQDTPPPPPLPPAPAPMPIRPKQPFEPQKLWRLSRAARDLNISNQQLKATVSLNLSEFGRYISKLGSVILELKDFELGSTKEMEELRTLYKREALERKLLYNQLQELRGNIRVFCRCCPDSHSLMLVEFPSDDQIIVNQNGKKKFQFDRVFAPHCTQEDVFDGTLPIIKSCVDGYNICILAYGQTGSGKTYTMMGTEDKPGVNIRSIRELLRICQEREKIKYTTKISMLEIYNETIKDLLSKNPSEPLEIRTHGKSVTVPGLTEIEVSTEADIKDTITLGEKNRTVASTKMNTESSRSHLMVMLHVNGIDNISGVASYGTLTLCDLAGSERISKTEATGQRLVEAAAINKSLTSLGQVFTALKNNTLHVPYRNSKLTHLLQPSLSGNAKACVFVNVSTDAQNLGETLSSLQFGSSIQQVALGKAPQNIGQAKPEK
ncbi:kinesin-like protein klp-3 [Rhinatrema bivittatum]|uniref:kinesin-like protein klp-3 n=1 Tax=Rhinatrema bivittatum TaxID=194408 RepID=UPI0011264792|nr:kinesin-like protein klp-3 [Rhinatrema bivittatum]XP_029472796.1 kinesin-like protein klp-3 [Rhinatrema bivittatum]